MFKYKCLLSSFWSSFKVHTIDKRVFTWNLKERKKKTWNLTRAAIAASDHKCSSNDSPTIIEWSRKIKVCYNNNRSPRGFFPSLSKPNKNICLIFLLTNQDCWVIDSFFVEGEVLGQLFYTLRETNKTKTHWRLVIMAD